MIEDATHYLNFNSIYLCLTWLTIAEIPSILNQSTNPNNCFQHSTPLPNSVSAQMDTTEAIYTTIISDLPTEVIEIILQQVVSYKDRKSSRSVCGLWRDLINRDSSSEKYVISRKKIISNRGNKSLKFRHLISIFLSYKREKINLEFKCINLEETNEYWNNKGKHIVGLKFEHCKAIPIEEVCTYCNKIKEIKIISFCDANRQYEIFGQIEKIVEKGIVNSSVHFVKLQFSYVHKEQVFDFIPTIKRIFPYLKELHLVAVKLYEFDDLDTISRIFANYKFKIVLKSLHHPDKDLEGLEVAFNSSPDKPISLLHLDINMSRKSAKQLLDSIYKYYYKDLCSLIVKSDGFISLKKFRKLISNSSLKVLKIAASHIDACKFQKNQPKGFIFEYLGPLTINSIQIEKNLVDSYQNVTILRVYEISFIGFAKIVKELTSLKRLHCEYVEHYMVENSYKEIVTSESLQSLNIPMQLLVPTLFAELVYHFPNLEELTFPTPYSYLNRNINHKDLKCMNCPQLKELNICSIEFLDNQKSDVYIKAIRNILYLFPNIVSLIFFRPKLLSTRPFFYKSNEESKRGLPINDFELMNILKNCPKLRRVNCFQDDERRIKQLHKYLMYMYCKMY